ncbi:MAG: Gfo/Idh/MocA family oxidoreductase, partial [Nitrospira sp.]|nr:Gfo/Idh/MocA family oxidoreductase [Nitrospira sp.]
MSPPFSIGETAAPSVPALRHGRSSRAAMPAGVLVPVVSRRMFLASAVVAGTVCATRRVVASSAIPPPSERINVGVIGLGAMGMGHLRLLSERPETRVVAVCDVDRRRREEGVRIANEASAAGRSSGDFKVCSGHNDFRELLVRDDVDAVVIATPDHWHTPMSVEAARAGKDIYCEKPVSLTLDEGRRLVDAVRRAGRVFQTGTQYRSIPVIRRVCEFVRAGGLGKLRGVFTIWMKTQVPTVGPSMVPLDPVLPEEKPPEGLDWDLWVGPAAYRPYHSAYHRNPSPGVVPWVFCEAFGAGAVTGYHSHAADVIQYAIGHEAGGPVEILHPADGPFPTLTCRYADGTLVHHLEHWGEAKSLYGAVPDHVRLEGLFGGLFVGERGWVTSMSASGPIESGPREVTADLNLW